MEITGRMTANANVKTIKGGKKVTEFTIAINDSYRPSGGERVQITTYIECAYWRNAGVAEYLKKGTLVTVSGRLGAEAWVNRSGEAKATITFHVSEIKILGNSGKAGIERADSVAVKMTTAGAGADDDDLPF
ncbi:single-stranded DNA-binding protein [Mucilaginibacter sp. PAMB04274]|uniref:single-stranded DNA-binding protein n=1 Tax=Mucilaginibacter sp. PAMB04274 TaxID=3138568 RepID=UPI0031F709D1